MQITVPLDEGFLPSQYGKQASDNDRYMGRPIRSFPILLDGPMPKGTKSLALTFIDHDAIPVAGFTWIHWIAANLDPNLTEIPENASQLANIDMVQGNNSTAGGLVNESDPQLTQRYNGPTPPDRDHNYTLTVYALDTMLDLKPGFWLNELMEAMTGHVLDQESVTVPARH